MDDEPQVAVGGGLDLRARSSVRVLHDHTRTKEGSHEWVSAFGWTNQYRRLDRIGRNGNGTWRWDLYGCNNPDCEGALLLRAGAIEEALTRTYPGPPPLDQIEEVFRG